MSTINNNNDRADRAMRTLDAYIEGETERQALVHLDASTLPEEDKQTRQWTYAEIISDMVADLGHLAAREGLDPELVIQQGVACCREEAAEEANEALGNVAQPIPGTEQ